MTCGLYLTALLPSYSVYVGVSWALPQALASYTIPIPYTIRLAPTPGIDLSRRDVWGSYVPIFDNCCT